MISRTKLIRTKVSLVLLLLIAIRVVPFGLLHYHNNQFGGITLNNPTSHTVNAGLSNYISYCTLDDFLSLTTSGFVLATEYELPLPIQFETTNTVAVDSGSNYLLFEILNKGSPQPV